DMGSALLMASTDAARGAGVASDRLVFPLVLTTAHDTWRVGYRDVLERAPAMELAGKRALELAGLQPGQLDHVDLYSCFPAIVEMSTAALDVDPNRPLSVIGGLGFAGSPVANSAGQSIAAMVPLLREGGYGLVHANGGHATKHAFGVYGSRPPDRFIWEY